MAKKFGKFHVECDMHGTTISATSHRLTAGCLDEAEIDWHINSLQNDLEACRREMKRNAKYGRHALVFQRA